MGRIVLGRTTAHETKPALYAEGVRHGSCEDAARTEHTPDLRHERVGELEVLEEFTGNDDVEARALERQLVFDVGLDRLDSESCRFLEGGRIDVEADDRVPLEEVPGERARTTAEVEHALPAANGGDEERDTLGNEDEVAPVSSLAVVLFVAFAERAHAEPTAAPCPSEAIVLRRPFSSAISGSHPRICFARMMSGLRTCGSSTGNAS